jgi:NTE family protein
MYDDFNPDFIIGSTVTANAPDADEDNVYLQIRNMLMTKTDFDPACENGVLIKPWSDVGIFSFDQASRLIDSGYVSTLKKIIEIKSFVTSVQLKEETDLKRIKYKNGLGKIIFENIEIEGLTKKQSQYVKKLFVKKQKELSLEKIKPRYFRLAEDDKIKSLFPVANFNSVTKKYTLKLTVKKEKPFAIELGGNLSNRPISEGFVGLRYKYLGKAAVTIYGNTYFGKLNTSVHGKIRFDLPSKMPFYIEGAATYSRFDYFKSSTLLYDLLKPAYLTQRDRFAELNLGFPFGNRAKFVLNGGAAELRNIYYQTENFSNKDTADRTDFLYGFGSAEYELNTLNRKQYASEGLYVNAKAKYFNGLESYFPGTTSTDTIEFDVPHQWIQFSSKFDYYLKTNKRFKIGLLGEGVYSFQDFFKNYFYPSKWSSQTN